MTFGKILRPAPSILLILACTLGGCEGPQGPTGEAASPQIYVMGKITSEPLMWPTLSLDQNYPVSVFLNVLDSPSIPEVKANGYVCSINLIAGDEINYLEEDLPIALGASVHLSVTYAKEDGSLDSAGADVILPGNFDVIYPDTSSTIYVPWGSDLELGWTPSSGAESYVLFFDMGGSYWDTAGSYESWYYSLDTTILSTSITFPLSAFWPDTSSVDSVLSTTGEVRIWAQHGPWQEYDMGNVWGAGGGFFYGQTFKYLIVEGLEPGELVESIRRLP